MKLKDLLKLAQTDIIEALKEAYDMGASIGTADQEYTEDQFKAYMDGAKDSIEIEGDKLAKLNERINILERDKTVPPSYPTYPTQPAAPTISPFWYQSPTCQVGSKVAAPSQADSPQPTECNNL